MTHYSMNIFQSSASALLVLLTAAAIAPTAQAAATLSPSDALPADQLISQVGVLRLDSRGPAVGLLQQQLTTLGYFSGVVTEFFGPVTEDAVRRFQRDAGLTADGIVGPGTDAAIQQRLTPPPTAASGTLRLNDTGEQVSVLQRRLTELGYFSGPVTGTFGPLTQTAVISFQQASGLTADGIVGTGTADALRRATVPQTPAVRPPASGGSTNTLRRGDTGTGVADLQTRLRQLRYYDGPVNGSFGPRTEEAVRFFQRSQGLPEDGVAGAEVNSALERLASSSANPEAPSTTASNAPEPQIQERGTYEGVDRYSVAELQRRLQGQGNYAGEENNVLTPETREGIVESQREHGLKPGDLAR
jgi:peptidoglycan hydrolase-like protein with peptidoglycan-binding domain